MVVVVEVPRGSKSSKSSSELFVGVLALKEEVWFAESFDFFDGFDVLNDVLPLSLLKKNSPY